MPMSSSKYKRLFIVSFIPLMALGFLTSKFVFHLSGMKYSFVTCAPFMDLENCRQVGDPSGDLYKRVESEHPAWFDVEVGDYDVDAPYQNFISASTRILSDAQIVRASSYFSHTSRSASVMESLPGHRAVIKLGIEDGESSFIHDGIYVLYCNSLKFESKGGEYTSGCYGDEWSGRVTYQASGHSRDQLDKLLSSVRKIDSQRKSEYNIFRVVMYPLFVYLFIILSLVVFIVSRAVRYVKSG